ncbi:MAG: 1,4-dihydroxy-2-naphthoate polyprenyltransferase [Egibacteraceae bacterium]
MHVWVEAARPRTLAAAVAPVLVGTAAAQRLSAWRFLGALVVALALQVGVNYANDYYDGVRGIDTAERVGPRRAVAAGLVAPARMRTAMLVAFAVAGVAGVILAAAVGWELLVVGLACFAAAVGYSGGPRPYASAGLGELFVFVCFGLVATVGSAYVQAERVLPVAVAAAVPIGLLITAILVANNARDIATDTVAGKRTLAVRLGRRRTGLLYAVLVAGAFTGLSVIALLTRSLAPLLALAAVPLAVLPCRLLTSPVEGAPLLPALAGTARLVLVFAVLLAGSLLLV